LREIPLSVSEHDRIIRAIARGNGPAAERAVFNNWRNAAKRLSGVIARVGELANW